MTRRDGDGRHYILISASSVDVKQQWRRTTLLFCKIGFG
jgi:hypothetical protein